MTLLFILWICNLDQMGKDVSRKPNLNTSGRVLKISLPPFSNKEPTLGNVLHWTLFHQHEFTKPKCVFSVKVFSHNLIQSLCFVTIWLVFKPLQKLQLNSLSTKLHLLYICYTLWSFISGIQTVSQKKGN